MMIPGILPEGTSLFILSGIAREIGIVGAMAVLMLYVLLLCQLYTITCSAADALGFYLGVAITGYFTITFIINIFMTVGLLPVSSIYIPFLAYGGSRHLLNFAMIGIMLNISRYGEVRE